MDSCASALEFNERLFQLTKDLADASLVVERLECHWGHFGSWLIEVSLKDRCDAYGSALLEGQYDVLGPSVLRCSWDGRDRKISLSKASPNVPLSGPTGYTELESKVLNNFEKSITFSRAAILKWSATLG